MATPAYCLSCHMVDDYPAMRGNRIADMRCRKCNAGPGRLARRGSKLAVQAARQALETVRGIGGLCDEHLLTLRRTARMVWPRSEPFTEGDKLLLRELDALKLVIYDPARPNVIEPTTTGYRIAWLLDDAMWSPKASQLGGAA